MNRIYHPWWLWECYPAGFYDTKAKVEDEVARNMYKTFLQDLKAFGAGMDRVFAEWPHSCEQFLTNTSMNRIAWLGQSAMCITTGIPSCYRGGFKLLSQEEQDAADALAQEYLTKWENKRNENI